MEKIWFLRTLYTSTLSLQLLSVLKFESVRFSLKASAGLVVALRDRAEFLRNGAIAQRRMQELCNVQFWLALEDILLDKEENRCSNSGSGVGVTTP